VRRANIVNNYWLSVRFQWIVNTAILGMRLKRVNEIAITEFATVH